MSANSIEVARLNNKIADIVSHFIDSCETSEIEPETIYAISQVVQFNFPDFKFMRGSIEGGCIEVVFAHSSGISLVIALDKRNLSNPIPNSIFDTVEGIRKCAEKIQYIQSKYDVQIMFTQALVDQDSYLIHQSIFNKLVVEIDNNCEISELTKVLDSVEKAVVYLSSYVKCNYCTEVSEYAEVSYNNKNYILFTVYAAANTVYSESKEEILIDCTTREIVTDKSIKELVLTKLDAFNQSN